MGLWEFSLRFSEKRYSRFCLMRKARRNKLYEAFRVQKSEKKGVYFFKNLMTLKAISLYLATFFPHDL